MGEVRRDISGRTVNVHDSADGFVVKADEDAAGGNVASSSAKSTVSALGATDGGVAAERRRGLRRDAYSPLRAKSANGARRSQVGFSGARADRVRGFVGSRAIAARAARAAFAFA